MSVKLYLGVALSGALMGAGLVVSGMTQPAKVLAFLDITRIAQGSWDATLAFVLAAALLVTFVGYRIVLRRAAPLCAQHFQIPTSKKPDARLMTGSALFGIGWGLAGVCPGPALANLVLPTVHGLGFMAAMVLGIAGVKLYNGTKKGKL